MSENTASFRQFARLIGCKPSYVTDLNKTGRLVLDAQGRVLVAESRARIAATKDPSRAGVAARHATARGAALAVASPAAEEPELEEPTGDDAADRPLEASPEERSFQHWKARNEKAKALAQERENAQAEGKLLQAQDVTHAVAGAVTGLRTRLESLPDILAPQLAAIQDEQRARALLAQEIEHILDECARGFSAIAREAA